MRFKLFVIRLIAGVLKFLLPMRLIEAIWRTLADEAPPTSDVVYLYGQTVANQWSLLAKAAKMYKEGLADKIALPGFEAKAGFPGFTAWRDSLVRLGVKPEHIIAVPYDTGRGESFNTLTESIDLIRFAEQEGWRELTVVAAPFHVLRCFFSVVGQVLKQEARVRVFACQGAPLSWRETTVASQGTLTGTRASLIAREVTMTLVYGLKGDLPSPKEVIKYLNWR